MVGAHLDSVQAGPGIQDNGTGSAAILEIALQMATVKPLNTVRFAWWGGEESGLIGSTAYVGGLTDAESKASPFTSTSTCSALRTTSSSSMMATIPMPRSGPGPDGSAQIEKLFEAFFLTSQPPFAGTDFDGRSDYGPFIAVGIPAGGLFTGAEGIKTPDEVALWGGTAGDPIDPCYHLACDTFDNINDFAYATNTDSVAILDTPIRDEHGSRERREGQGQLQGQAAARRSFGRQVCL